MRRILAAAVIVATLHAPTAATAAPRTCRHLDAEAFIRCAETGGQARYAPDRTPHPGKSSASGAYGLLSSTRRIYGAGCTTDRCIAAKYVEQRYGGWVQAAHHHRRRGWY